jgi:S-adenosylmethionine hydrolase
MTKLQLITLLTDLGVTDAYVGIVKGVLYAHAPNTKIVDLPHADRRGSARKRLHLW